MASKEPQTNARIGDLPLGALFRSYRTAPSAWRVDGVIRDGLHIGRIRVHNLYDPQRQCHANAAMSVFHIPALLDEADDPSDLLGVSEWLVAGGPMEEII